ncbi:Serine/threonine phosphatase stp [subsurface metagenome]
MFEMTVAGQTDPGRARKNNEDAFFIEEPLLLVADGMGGAAAGEIASSLAIDVISSSLKDISYTSDEEIINNMEQAIFKADSEIKAQTKKDPDIKGMGTTLVTAIHLDDRLLIGHVGDSRAYIISQNISEAPAAQKDAPKLDSSAETAVLQKFTDDHKPSEEKDKESIRRITQDHSVVMDLVQSGVILEDEIRTHPLRNRITRCVGNFVGPGPEFVWHDLSNNETLIICSDGLWEMVYDELIFAIVKSSKNPEEMCKRLIDAANEKGGADNITVIAANFIQK